MPIQSIPEIYAESKDPEFLVHNFKMTETAVKNKVNLTLHMFSFLQKGEKKVHFEDAFVEVNNKQSVLIKLGNCLMTELLDKEQVYFCKLFFFTTKNITDFLNKYNHLINNNQTSNPRESPFFIIENDTFINSFATSISSLLNGNSDAKTALLAIKFEEIMLYLSHKYGSKFINYLQNITVPETNISLRKIVEANVNSNLTLLEIAFLANMSLSTFKRYFEKEYHTNPGKWFKEKRLDQAKRVLEKGEKKPTEIYFDYGYNNFSNFSIAFKNKFGVSPKQIQKFDTE